MLSPVPFARPSTALPALCAALLAGLGWRLIPAPPAPEPSGVVPAWLEEVAGVCNAASSAARLAESAAQSAVDLAAGAPLCPPPPAACEPCVCPEPPEDRGLEALAVHALVSFISPVWLWLANWCFGRQDRRPEPQRHAGPARTPGSPAPVARGGGVVR